jgi:hypothetical protein
MNYLNRTPRSELTSLRVSIARIAQAIGVQTEDLLVLNKSYDELCKMAKKNERGWNILCGEIRERILERETIRETPYTNDGYRYEADIGTSINIPFWAKDDLCAVAVASNYEDEDDSTKQIRRIGKHGKREVIYDAPTPPGNLKEPWKSIVEVMHRDDISNSK